MKSKISLSLFFSLVLITSKAQTKILTKQQVRQDIESLRKILNENSSYAYLNGYDFNKDFEDYQQNLEDSIRLEDFGLFLTKTIGKIGDRHSSVREYETRDSLFLPFIYAPLNNKVIVLKKNANKELEIFNPDFPYLKNIDGISTENFLSKILPEEVKAPKDAYFKRAVRKIRDVQKNYNVLNKKLPKEFKLTLSNSASTNDTVLAVSPVKRLERAIYWDEKFEKQFGYPITDTDYNKPEISNQLFEIKNQIAYTHIPAMVSKEDAPLLFDKLNSFMNSIRNNSKALIVDVRSNGGGTRDISYEFAKYFVHPDSIYVVNVTKQRGPIPLPKDYIESLHSRNLFSFPELDNQEQKSVTEFLKTFKPMYELDNNKYSEYYFGLLNGKKLAKSFYYNKPVYILANENSFSAASVLVAIFKGLPNVKIVGVTTDGSSGNSDRFELPNSEIRIKISTMVSFQKDGKILDGYGTEPDIEIERDRNQILWKSDTQLEKLRSLILSEK